MQAVLKYLMDKVLIYFIVSVLLQISKEKASNTTFRKNKKLSFNEHICFYNQEKGTFITRKRL